MKGKAKQVICTFLLTAILSAGILTVPANTAYAEETSGQSAVLYSVSAVTVKGTWIKSSNGKWWYKHTDGTYTKNNWEYIDGSWYFFDANGWMLSAQWKQWEGKWYYLNPSGVMHTGWLKDNGKWYYFSSRGIMQTGWITINGKEYFLCDDGHMHIGWLERWNGTFYLNSDGSMQVGWKKISGSWYYFETSGKMQKGWISLNNKKYYLNANGVMQIGWKKINNIWYHFKSDGAMNTTDLLEASRYYVFKSSGELYKTEILLPRQQQQKDNWCWAACSSMVGIYNTESKITQTEIVKFIKNEIVDEGGNAYEITDAINYASGYTKKSTPVVGHISYKQAVEKIDANHPFVVALEWNSGGAHAMVCSGYDKNENKVQIINPWKDIKTQYYNYKDIYLGVDIEGSFGKCIYMITY